MKKRLMKHTSKMCERLNGIQEKRYSIQTRNIVLFKVFQNKYYRCRKAWVKNYEEEERKNIFDKFWYLRDFSKQNVLIYEAIEHKTVKRRRQTKRLNWATLLITKYCLNAIYKAASFGIFNFDDFDLTEYEKYEQTQNGDLNWMVPEKLLAFLTPSTENGTIYHPPECYINYFLNNNVVAVVRLNKKTYDSNSFTKAGISHYDMFMPDGTVPPKRILYKFLKLVETTNGAIAVHCKAGLGRTGSLIAAYLIKHYTMTAREAIAWTRICRTGSVIGHQQAWLENIECSLLNAGKQYRLKYHGNSNMVLQHRWGIYSIAIKLGNDEHRGHSETNYPNNNHQNNYPDKLRNVNNRMINKNTESSNSKKTRNNKDLMKCRWKLNDVKGTSTQGDKLNEIKINRAISNYR
ncbi:hypothetical protein M0802_009241 [Mischocyttarus mexicanus]|nr:hypothetical protein M0802_009241 [Mischocyttarus mexicanus]